MKKTIERRRKSEVLTLVEVEALSLFISNYHTLVDAADAIGISRQVLERVKIIGSGSPETVTAIRKAIKGHKGLKMSRTNQTVR